MLGITDSCFRTAFMETIGGFDYGISPFLRTLQGQRFKPAKVNDLVLKKNKSLSVVPQILTNQVEDFIRLATVLYDMGHATINLNMGCPVPTSAGRGRGAGLLPECEFVDRLIDKVLSKIPNHLSIKTRIGLENDDDILRMATVFNRYPLKEIIIHPRTASQKYQGHVNHNRFSEACKELIHEVVYSGDIFCRADFEWLKKQHPGVKKWMVGRGMLKDPFIVHKLRQSDDLDGRKIRTFYVNLFELYSNSNITPKSVSRESRRF